MSEAWLRKVMTTLKIRYADKPKKEEVLPKKPSVAWKKYGKNW